MPAGPIRRDLAALTSTVQVPSSPHGAVAVSFTHMLRGFDPTIAFAQMPSAMPVYVFAHALHAPAHASLQHTPSRHEPLVQSPSATHPCPFGCFVVPASPPSAASAASRPSLATSPPPASLPVPSAPPSVGRCR